MTRGDGAAPRAAARPATALIVTYQSARTLGATLQSARRNHDAGLLEIIAIDNGSTDDTAAVLQRESGWLRAICTGQNNGFGRGCNIGLAHVTTPYTLLLNPDAAIEPEALRTMLAFMEANPRVGITGPCTVCGEPGQAIVYQGAGRLSTPGAIVRDALPFGNKRPPLTPPILPGSAPARVEWVCGAVLLIRTELLQRLGGFDPRFFLYWEETDLCRRVLDAGAEVWAVGTAVAHHVCGASSAGEANRIHGFIASHYYRSRRYYLVKHHGWWMATVAEFAEFVLLALRAGLDSCRGRPVHALRARLQAPLLSQPTAV